MTERVKTALKSVRDYFDDADANKEKVERRLAKRHRRLRAQQRRDRTVEILSWRRDNPTEDVARSRLYKDRFGRVQSMTSEQEYARSKRYAARTKERYRRRYGSHVDDVEAGSSTDEYDMPERPLDYGSGSDVALPLGGDEDEEKDEDLGEGGGMDAQERRRLKLMMAAENLDRPPIYEGHILYSREKWMAAWGIFKGIMFFFLLVGGAYIATFDYNKRPCGTGTLGSGAEYCLNYNSTTYCVGIDDETCLDVCAAQIGFGIMEGCLVHRHSPSITDASGFYQCYDAEDMEKVCKDTTTCTDQAEGDVLDGIKLLAFVFAMGTLFDLTSAAGLCMYSSWQHDEFYEPRSRFGNVVFNCTKYSTLLGQVLWLTMLFAFAYLCFVLFSAGGDCQDAVTISGQKNDFWDDSTYFTLTGVTVVLVFIVVGTILRLKAPVRGELFMPSWEDQVVLHMPIDCRKQRSREPKALCSGEPRCAPDCFKDLQCKAVCGRSRCYQGTVHGCCFAIDRIVVEPFLMLGAAIEWMYFHRHFIGP